MKKRRFFGLFALLFSMGISGCTLGDGGSTKKDDEPTGELTWVGTKENHYQVDSKGSRVSEPEPHTLVDSEGDKDHVPMPPTCTKPGKGFQQCSICKKYLDTIVEPLGHDLIDNGGTTASCYSAGDLDLKCSRDGWDYVEQKHVDKPLNHKWGTEETLKDGITKKVCGWSFCGEEAITLDCTKTTSGWKADSSNYKCGSSKEEVTGTWDVSGFIPDGNYKIFIECEMTSSSHNARYFFNHGKFGKTDPASSGNEDTSSQADYRYEFSLNGRTNYITPDNQKTYEENGMSADDYVYVELVSRCSIADASTFAIHHGIIGYSLNIRNVQLIKLAD